MSTSFVIPNVPSDRFAKVLSALVESGQGAIRWQTGAMALVSVQSPVGNILAEVSLRNEAMTVTVVDKPLLVPMGTIEERVRAAVAQVA